MAELRFIIQSDQLVAFLGHKVTKCFVSELHAGYRIFLDRVIC